MSPLRTPPETRAASRGAQSRIYNRRLVFDALRQANGLSKAELARETGLTPQTIAAIVDELKAVRFVRESGRRSTPRGQPPVVIEIDPQGGYGLGIRVDRERFDLVVSDLVGDIVHAHHGETPSADTAYLVEFLSRTCEEMVRASRLPKKRVLGLGLVTPGPFDAPRAATPSPGSLPGFQTRAIATTFSERLGVPVLLENDATAAAMSENLFGVARHLRDFFYVFVAEGVGAGLICDGRAYRGGSGNAGEFGHMIIHPGGRRCYCGNSGCLGQYLSLASLAGRLEAAGTPLSGLGEIETRLANGDPGLEAWLGEAADALRLAIASIENLFDPQAIVLGGTAPVALLQALSRRVEPLLPSLAADGPSRLVVVEDARDSIAHGAAILPIAAATSPIPAVLTGGEELALPSL
mgnify:CR=1 FL=1|jgi:Transcriptional regulator/sugar kinase